MKRILALAAAATFLAGAAYAEPTVQVQIPADLTTAESVAAYKASLDSAVVSVCRRVASPVIGVNYYRYQACLEATRARVSATEPTGIYGRADGAVAAVDVAAR